VGQTRKEGIRATLVAVTGVVVPGALGFWVSYQWFGMPMIPSLFVGGTIVATSIGITVRVLKDLNQHNTRCAHHAGRRVLDDVIGVVVLAVLSTLLSRERGASCNGADTRVHIDLSSHCSCFSKAFFMPLHGKACFIDQNQGHDPHVIISLILGMAVISHKVGAPENPRLLCSGIALARRFFLPLGASIDHYSHQLAEKDRREHDLDHRPVCSRVLRHGRRFINLRAIDMTSGSFWGFAGVLTIVAVLSKMASGIWAPGAFVKNSQPG